MEGKEPAKVVGLFAQLKQKTIPDASAVKKCDFGEYHGFRYCMTTIVNSDPEKKPPGGMGF